jgi:hypothetical protein
MVDRGAAFDTGGHLEIPHTSSLDLQRFTLEAWVKPEWEGPNNDALGRVIFQKSRRPPVGTNTVSVALWWEPTESRFQFGFGDIWSERITSTHWFPAGRFYHVAATYDGAVFKLYVNGKLEGTRALQKTVVYDASVPWGIGSAAAYLRDMGYPRTWTGVIDEVGIHSRALTPEELAAIVSSDGKGRCRPEAGAAPAAPAHKKPGP